MKLAALKKVKLPVQTVEKAVIKSAKIPKNKLSRKLAEFCGDYSAYRIEEVPFDDMANFSINHQGMITTVERQIFAHI